MRTILLLLFIAACTHFPKRDPEPWPEPEYEPAPQEQPTPKKKPEKPVTIITVNPPAKPQAVCVPLAVNEKKRILQALDCLLDAEPPKK